MSRKVTKKQIAEIIKNQPRVVLKKLDFAKLEKLGVKNVQAKEVEKATIRRSTRKKTKATLNNQESQNSTQKAVKTIAIRTKREIVRTTKVFRENNVVLVKWPYFPDWPAIIQSIKGNSIYVRFFGDGG